MNLSEVSANMLAGFELALSVDGSSHSFSFSNGVDEVNNIDAEFTVLWIKNISTEFHLHTHGLNSVLRKDERLLMMRASDVPDHARLYANDLFDCDDEEFRIISSRIKDGIWTLQLEALGSV